MPDEGSQATVSPVPIRRQRQGEVTLCTRSISGGDTLQHRRFRRLCAAFPTDDRDRRPQGRGFLAGPRRHQAPAPGVKPARPRRSVEQPFGGAWPHFAGRRRLPAALLQSWNPSSSPSTWPACPKAWVALEEAITYHAKQMVAWSLGREVREFAAAGSATASARGSRPSRSLAIRARAPGAHPRAGPHQLDVRDRQLCAYCGKRFLIRRDLSRTMSCRSRAAAATVDQHRNRLPQLQHAGRALALSRRTCRCSTPCPTCPTEHGTSSCTNRRILADQMGTCSRAFPARAACTVARIRCGRVAAPR